MNSRKQLNVTLGAQLHACAETEPLIRCE